MLSSHDEFRLEWPDGRQILVKRATREGRVVVEAADRRHYDRKAQAKLRRSFPEPREDLLPNEVARQVGLLFKALDQEELDHEWKDYRERGLGKRFAERAAAKGAKA